MTNIVNKFFIVLIPLLVIGVAFNMVPFIVVLTALLVRLAFSDKYTTGVFLLIFGGILASTIRFEFPSIPAYGLLFNFIGLILICGQLKYFRYESSSILSMGLVLLYFFFSFILSPNTNDYRGPLKISGIIINGIMMLFGYYAFIHSSKISYEKLAQALFLTTLLLLIHNMNLLGCAPKNFYDYEWLRKSIGDVMHSHANDDKLLIELVNYQVVGVTALFGLCIYLSQLTLNKVKVILYSLIALQLVLTSGARQAIFGYFIIVILRLTIFNKSNLTFGGLGNKLKYIVLGVVLVFVALGFIEQLNLDFLTNTLTEGDVGRDMLKVMGLNLFFKHPLFGAGIAGFNHVYPGMLYPHNFFIEILCECGAIGAIFLIVVVIRHLYKEHINLLYLTQQGSFFFLIFAVTAIRMFVSNDLTSSIEIFSMIFACSSAANKLPDEELQSHEDKIPETIE